ncbi:glycosyltransferase [Thermoanaerobacterium saccharolyticum]|uniref:glycosyltransferase n=1 Tax=Thermoanaerobacterium saccharolyticum TaxID=28896 RepID=UPI002FDB4186
MEIFYIGNFPPPYGGATIKNDIIFKELSKYLKIEKFNTSVFKHQKYNMFNYLKLLLFLLRNKNNKGIICIHNYSLFKLTKIINILDKDMLKNISVFINGGIFDEVISKMHQNIEIYKNYKNIYVELYKMKDNLNNLGLNNVNVIPNCRPKPPNRKFYANDKHDEIKCVFMSRICYEKGVNLIIEAAKLLNHNNIPYTIDFYGPIDKKFKDYFVKEISDNNNLRYLGIFKSEKENVYDLLKNYDVLLFPSIYEGEGFPGILTEAKIAGIPIIASDFRDNSRIVKHMNEGIILSENNSEKLYETISMLYMDKELLYNMRYSSYLSGEKYFIENYTKFILDRL